MQDYTTRCAELEKELAAVRSAARAESLAAEVGRVTRLFSTPAPGWIKALVGCADPLTASEAALLRVVTGDALPTMPRVDMLNLSMDAAREAPSMPGDKSGYPRQWLRKLAQCMDPATILGTIKFLATPPGVKTMTRGPRKGETVALDKRKEFHLSLSRQVVKWLDSTARPGDKDGDYPTPLSFRQRKFVGAFKATAGAMPDATRACEDVCAMLAECGCGPVDGYDLDDTGPYKADSVTRDAAVDVTVVADPDPPQDDEEAASWAAWGVMAGAGCAA